MRTKLFAIAAGLVLAIGAGGCASQREATQPSTQSDHYQYVTGSYVPQNVQKSGPVTNGRDNLRIIDQNEIQQSGGATLEQTLRQLGANH
jgi:hypothetical protein